MSSGYSPWWSRYILYRIPGLFKRCTEGNYHWFWEQACYCCDCCHVWIFKTGRHCVSVKHD